MSSTITKSQFVGELAAQHGTIDVDNLSTDTLRAMKRAGLVDESGVSTKELAQIAGGDGRIRGAAEMGALFDFVDKFDRGAATKTPSIDVAPQPGLDGSPELPPSGELYEAMKREVAMNRSKAWLTPNAAPAAPQSRMTVANDAAVTAPDQQAQKPVSLGMKGISQFDYGAAHGIDGATACAPTAFAQANEHNQRQLGSKAPRLEGPEQAIQVAYAEDANGRTEIDGAQAERGKKYIDKCLDRGLPVVVGVSYGVEGHNEGLTDHFVTIDGRGYDADGRQFYTFKDPGDGGRAGTLYVDRNQDQLFKEGDGKTNYVRSADYEVTQVRTYAGIR